MSKIQKLIFTILLIALCSQIAVTQTIDGWRGLIIDEATPEQAERLLGKPDSDKPTDRWHLLRSNFFIKNIGKALRTLEYEKIDGFKLVKLKFDNDLKLVSIHLEPKSLDVNVLTNTYSAIEFHEGIDVKTAVDLMRPRNKNPRRDSNYWAATLELMAASEKTIFIAAGYGGSKGRITMIEFTSRTLENKTGSELLK